MNNKKCSLLFAVSEAAEEDDSLYDLSIDRSVRRFCPDGRAADYFLNVLAHPLRDTGNIVYRQQILADFRQCSGLSDALDRLFSRYDKIQADWIELRRSIRISHGEEMEGEVSPEARLERVYSSLRATSVFPRTILSFVSSLDETLRRYDISSEGLAAVGNYCSELLRDGVMSKVCDIAALFQYQTAAEHDFTFDLTLSPDLTPADIALTGSSLGGEGGDGHNARSGGVFGLFASRAAAKPLDSAQAEAVDYSTTLAADALERLDTALTTITGDVYDVFHGLSDELMFYKAAQCYCDFAAASELPLCVPVICDEKEDRLSLAAVRDLHLAAEGLRGGQIIPNDASISPDTDGLLIRGANSTGKTVFLRSVGTAQVFAQAGLPVLAESAELSVRSGIFTHFSSAEEEFNLGDTAGRFEGEVRKVAAILDVLRPHSLLLLNETFQTTAYAEGAAGMRDILAYLPRAGCKFIFVTHLGQMFDPISDGSDPLAAMNIRRMKTAGGYRLEDL